MKDPILKERLFGLTNSEGNHGEDEAGKGGAFTRKKPERRAKI